MHLPSTGLFYLLFSVLISSCLTSSIESEEDASQDADSAAMMDSISVDHGHSIIGGDHSRITRSLLPQDRLGVSGSCSRIKKCTINMVTTCTRGDLGPTKKRLKEAKFVFLDGMPIPLGAKPKSEYDETIFIHPANQSVNFYINDEGVIYEGLGWDLWNPLTSEDLTDSFIIISFIVPEFRSTPSDAAKEALARLVNYGVCSKFIAPRYYLTLRVRTKYVLDLLRYIRPPN